MFNCFLQKAPFQLTHHCLFFFKKTLTAPPREANPAVVSHSIRPLLSPV